MSVAFGVQNQGSVGTTAAELRQIMRYKWGSAGVVGGLAVTGGSGLSYSVAAGMAVCTKGASDGFTEAPWPGVPCVTPTATRLSASPWVASWAVIHTASMRSELDVLAETSPVAPPGQ